MIPSVGNKPIFQIIPARAVSQLKGLSSIDSFTFGKQNLRPAIIELFKKRGFEIGDIYLDNPARVRLMGMMPSFESLVAEGKTAEEIFFSKLGLSLFSSESESSAQTLYVLGDKENAKMISKAKKDVAIEQDRTAFLPPAESLDSSGITTEQIEAVFGPFDGTGSFLEEMENGNEIAPTTRELTIVVQTPVEGFDGNLQQRSYPVELVLDPVQFRNVLPIDPSQRIKVIGSIVEGLSTLLRAIPNISDISHIFKEYRNILKDNRNNPAVIDSAIEKSLAMIADANNKIRKLGGALLFSYITVPPDHSRLNEIHKIVTTAINNCSDSEANTKSLLEQSWLNLPAPELTFRVIETGPQARAADLDAQLNTIKNSIDRLSKSRGDHYWRETEYVDYRDILEAIGNLTGTLRALPSFVISDQMRVKLNDLLEYARDAVMAYDIFPRVIAMKAAILLMGIKESWESVKPANSDQPNVPTPPAPTEIAPKVPADLSFLITEIANTYDAIKQKSLEVKYAPEEKVKRMNQLKAIGLEMKFKYFDKEVVVPAWLEYDLLSNVDLLVAVVKSIGKNKVKELLKELLVADAFDVIQKYGVAPFIAMMEYFGSCEENDYLKWLRNNSQLIDKYGIAPYLVIADSAKEIEGFSLSALWFLQDYFQGCFNSAEELAALGIFLIKKIASIRDPRMTYLGAHLQLFSPSSNELDVVLKELDEYLSFYQRIFNKLCQPGAIGRDGGSFDNTFNSEFGKSKDLIKKIGLPAFENIIGRQIALGLTPLEIMDVLEIFQILESKKWLNSPEDLQSALSALESVFGKYTKLTSTGYLLPRNIASLLTKLREFVSFSSICKIAGLFDYYIDSKSIDSIDGLIADIGEEKLSTIIDALPSPARRGTLSAIRECAPFIDTPEDLQRFSEMIQSSEEPSLDNYLKRKG